MAERITNEVIVERLEGIKLLFHEQFNNVNTKLGSIETQTIKTNGRVNVLEDKVAKNRDILSKFIGAVIVINIVIGVAVTIALKYL